MHWGTARRTYFSRLNRLSMVTPVFISSVVLEDALGWAKLVGWYTRYCTCCWARSDCVAEKGSQSPFQGVQAFKLQLRNPLLQNKAQPLRATAQYTSWPAMFVQQVDHPHGALLPSIEPRCWCAISQVAASSNDPSSIRAGPWGSEVGMLVTKLEGCRCIGMAPAYLGHR